MFSYMLIGTLLLQLTFVLLADTDNFCIESTKVSMNETLSSKAVNGKRFVLVTFMKANWFRAANICKYNGMELASINSSEEQTIVGDLLDKSGFGVDMNTFWIGGSDLSLQNNWYWNSDGSPIQKYTNWQPGQPDNFMTSNDERCINLLAKIVDYRWNDYKCENVLWFVCEKPCGCTQQQKV